jgi:hypothetical protein
MRIIAIVVHNEANRSHEEDSRVVDMSGYEKRRQSGKHFPPVGTRALVVVMSAVTAV